jgi:hypothetical protein
VLGKHPHNGTPSIVDGQGQAVLHVAPHGFHKGFVPRANKALGRDPSSADPASRLNPVRPVDHGLSIS